MKMKDRKPQLNLLRNELKSYGGELLKTREGRSRGRPLDTRSSMHLVLRSSKAVGSWSFWNARNKMAIQKIIAKFSKKYGIKIHSMANVGNHLHFHIKLSNRYSFKPFIRAVTGAIAMAVTGVNRWNLQKKEDRGHFWDYRPFTRVVQSYRAFLNLRDYVMINQLEGFGVRRGQAHFILNSKIFLKSFENSGSGSGTGPGTG